MRATFHSLVLQAQSLHDANLDDARERARK